MPSARLLEVQRAIAANVRRWRARRGMKQEELAHAASLGAVHLRNVERGTENITIATFIAIADALKVRPAYLLRPATLPPLKAGRPKKRPERKSTPVPNQ
jgi:transcriptional regulator with XRE-family HTH domain